MQDMAGETGGGSSICRMAMYPEAWSASKVKPMVKSKGWTFPVLLDKQTKVVSERNPGKTLPYTELLDHTHSVVYKHQGYNAGDEVHLEEKVKEAVAARKAALGE